MAKRMKSLRAEVEESLRRLLPDPVREEATEAGMALVGGDPGLVAVRPSETSISVFVYGVRWDGPHTPVSDHRILAEVAWAEFRSSEAEALIAAHLLVQAAVVVRRSASRTCRYCKVSNPPEWQHGDDVCQSCAEQHLGIVH